MSHTFVLSGILLTNRIFMTDFQILKPDNYTSYLPIDVVAIYFNLGGPAEFRIVSRDHKTYQFNIFNDPWKLEELVRICEVFADFSLEKLEDEEYDNWRLIKVHHGEWLICDTDIYDMIDIPYINYEELRQDWVTIVTKALHGEKFTRRWEEW